MKDIFLVGACYVDTILSVPHYPEEDSKLRAESLTVRRGGNCPNSLEVLAQLLSASASLSPSLSSLRPSSSSVPVPAPAPAPARLPVSIPRTHLVSCLPDAKSSATARIKASFIPCARRKSGGAENEDDTEARARAAEFLESCIYREGVEEPASSFIVRSLRTGSRTIVNYNGIDEMTVAEFKTVVARFTAGKDESELGKNGSWWHFEGRIPETTLKCIRHLRSTLPTASISVEVEKPGREGLTNLAEAADIIFYSRSWAEARHHSNAKVCLEKETPTTASLALCTWGSEGATALSLPDRRPLVCPVKKSSTGAPLKVVDTIGAGDTFIAGMLYALTCHSADWDTKTKLEFAVDLATLKVQREGFEGLAQDIQRWL